VYRQGSHVNENAMNRVCLRSVVGSDQSPRRVCGYYEDPLSKLIVFGGV